MEVDPRLEEVVRVVAEGLSKLEPSWLAHIAMLHTTAHPDDTARVAEHRAIQWIDEHKPCETPLALGCILALLLTQHESMAFEDFGRMDQESIYQLCHDALVDYEAITEKAKQHEANQEDPMMPFSGLKEFFGGQTH